MSGNAVGTKSCSGERLSTAIIDVRVYFGLTRVASAQPSHAASAAERSVNASYTAHLHLHLVMSRCSLLPSSLSPTLRYVHVTFNDNAKPVIRQHSRRCIIGFLRQTRQIRRQTRKQHETLIRTVTMNVIPQLC